MPDTVPRNNLPTLSVLDTSRRASQLIESPTSVYIDTPFPSKYNNKILNAILVLTLSHQKTYSVLAMCHNVRVYTNLASSLSWVVCLPVRVAFVCVLAYVGST